MNEIDEVFYNGKIKLIELVVIIDKEPKIPANHRRLCFHIQDQQGEVIELFVMKYYSTCSEPGHLQGQNVCAINFKPNLYPLTICPVFQEYLQRRNLLEILN